MSSKSVIALVLFSCTSFFWAADVAAQTISPEKIAQAQKLYDEGSTLMEQGNFIEACPKLEQAVELVPEGVGAKLELAKCYEGAGRYASAWRAFKIAQAASGIAGQGERHERAKERAAALEPKLSTLTLVVPDTVRQLPGFVLTRNGVTVDRTDWNASIPVDGGSYRLEAVATGKNRWLRIVEINPTGARAQVEIGMLEDEPNATPLPTNGRPWQKPAGLAIGGVGLAGAAIGFILGGVAMSKNNDSKAPGRCDAQNQCDQTGLDLRHDAQSMASASTGLVIVGGALLAGGVILWATAPKAPPVANTQQGRRSQWNTAIEVGPSGLWVRGKW